MNIDGPSVVPTHPNIGEMERLGDEIAELAAHLDAATARLLNLIREFDERGGWGNGFRSCAHWLAWRVGLELGAAREHVGYQDADGMVVIRGRLEPEVGAVVIQALAAARDLLYRRRKPKDVPAGTCAVDASARTSVVDGFPEAPTMEQQQADALALVAEAALHHGINPGAPGERYQVVVHVDAAVLADADAEGQSVLEGEARVPAGTSQRLACDASRVVMRHDAEGRIIEVGARTRTIPPALRRALHHRDKGCRFPGCGRPFGEGHHIRHWANGGPTTLSNLAMLCRRHHRAVHEEGYQLKRQADGDLCFRRPDGRVLPDVPAPAAVPANPTETLKAQNDGAGIRINAQTSMPAWQGERLDVGSAISVLHPLAAPDMRSTPSA
jgi:Domain of unknown function (DUF222)/HNH endonuclease